MGESAGDPVGQAAARLEDAVEALARALARGFAPQDLEDLVPRAEVTAIADRLDATIARLRAAIAEETRRDQDGADDG